VLGEQLTAWDLDPEIPLQTEDDVQKINRFRAQVPLQGCLLGHVFLVHAQCIHQGRLDFLEDLIVRWHVILGIKGIAAQPQSRPTGRGTEDQVGSLNRRRKRAFNFKGLSSGKASQCVGLHLLLDPSRIQQQTDIMRKKEKPCNIIRKTFPTKLNSRPHSSEDVNGNIDDLGPVKPLGTASCSRSSVFLLFSRDYHSGLLSVTSTLILPFPFLLSSVSSQSRTSSTIIF